MVEKKKKEIIEKIGNSEVSADFAIKLENSATIGMYRLNLKRNNMLMM